MTCHGLLNVPGAASVDGVHDNTRSPDNPADVGIYEIHVEKVIETPDRIRHRSPGHTSIGCLDEPVRLSDCPTDVGTGKKDGKKSSLVIVEIEPCCASIISFQNVGLIAGDAIVRAD